MTLRLFGPLTGIWSGETTRSDAVGDLRESHVDENHVPSEPLRVCHRVPWGTLSCTDWCLPEPPVPPVLYGALRSSVPYFGHRKVRPFSSPQPWSIGPLGGGRSRDTGEGVYVVGVWDTGAGTGGPSVPICTQVRDKVGPSWTHSVDDWVSDKGVNTESPDSGWVAESDTHRYSVTFSGVQEDPGWRVWDRRIPDRRGTVHGRRDRQRRTRRSSTRPVELPLGPYLERRWDRPLSTLVGMRTLWWSFNV